MIYTAAVSYCPFFCIEPHDMAQIAACDQSSKQVPVHCEAAAHPHVCHVAESGHQHVVAVHLASKEKIVSLSIKPGIHQSFRLDLAASFLRALALKLTDMALYLQRQWHCPRPRRQILPDAVALRHQQPDHQPICASAQRCQCNCIAAFHSTGWQQLRRQCRRLNVLRFHQRQLFKLEQPGAARQLKICVCA